MVELIRTGLSAIAALSVAVPAFAQWTQVHEVPVADIFSVWTHGDTIAAGSDSTAFVSFDAGATWIGTAPVPPGANSIRAVRVHNGRLYAGTIPTGVFVSSNRGATWQSFNEGLASAGQLSIMNLLLLGDSLYAATDGGGAWIRNLRTPGPWSHYGNQIDLAQAGNMTSIAASPTRFLATGGGNGDVFYRDPGQADWTESLLLNDRLAAGLAPLAAIWTGGAWLVGSNIGVYRSPLGQSPWTYFDFGLHPTFFASFALHGPVVFTHFANGEGTGIEFSTDDGLTWQLLDAQPLTFTYAIATLGNTLYAARTDGLWRRPIDSVDAVPPGRPAGVRFAILGPHPIRDEARFRVELPEAGRVRIEVFDVGGRRAGERLEATLPAGASEVRWNAGDLAPGVYVARLTAGRRSQAVLLVRTR